MAEIYGGKMPGSRTGDQHRANWAPLMIVLVLLAVIVAIALIRG